MTEYRAKISLDTNSLTSATQAFSLAQAGTQAFSRAMSGDLVGALQSATVALRGLSAATKANVFLAIAAGAIAAGMAIRNYFTKSAEEAEKKLQGVREEYQRLQDQINRMNGVSKDPVEQAQSLVDRGFNDKDLETERDRLRKEARFQSYVKDNAAAMGDTVGSKQAELDFTKLTQAADLLDQELTNRSTNSDKAAAERQAEVEKAAGGRQEAERDLKFSRADTSGKADMLAEEIKLLRERSALSDDAVKKEELLAEATRKQVELDRLLLQQQAEWDANEQKQIDWEESHQAERDKNAGAKTDEEKPAAVRSPSIRDAGIEDEFDLMYQQQGRRGGLIRMNGSRDSAFNQGEPGAGFRSRLMGSAFARSRGELDERRSRLEASRATVISNGTEVSVDIGAKNSGYLKTIAENSGSVS